MAGIRVLELGHHLVGPLIGMYLGDMGAEVVKLEPPDGDPWRSIEVYPPLQDNGRFFIAINRNKRSIAVDLMREEGRQIAHRLAARSDVVVENFTPGTARTLGVDYDTLARVNANLIYCSVSAFGESGPWAHRRGFDLTVAGLAGLMVRGPGLDPPMAAPVAMTDCAAAFLAAFGVAAALLARERQGIAQKVETSLLDAAVALHAHRFVRIPLIPGGLDVPVGAFYRTYRTADGFINVVAYDARLSRRLLEAMGLAHLTRDPRFDTPVKMRQRAQELAAILQDAFMTRTTDGWLDVLDAAGVPCGPIRDLQDLFDHPQVRHNRGLITSDHPVAGPVEIPGIPVRLARTPATMRYPAPLLGQHTREILEDLGYAGDTIDRLQREGIIVAGRR